MLSSQLKIQGKKILKPMHSLQTIDYTDADAPKLFTASLRETGFGVLKNHPLQQQQVQHIYDAWQRFFDSDKKNEFLYCPEKFDGFFPTTEAESAKGHSTRDLKEYYHYYPWGRCPGALRQTIDDYYAQTISLATELLRWVQENTPESVTANFSEPLSTMIEGCSHSLLRILHYPPITRPDETKALRAQAHEDINLLTILPAANEPGLQVLTRKEDWLDVPCEFGNLIINTGDMLQEASGGYFPSTTHRVVNPEGNRRTRSRISLPLFLHPRAEVVLSERYTAGEYLTERLRELQQTDQTAETDARASADVS